jgi:hypothetical protein
MATQTMIELRRGDAIEDGADTGADADFTVVLKEPLTLFEGDAVVLHSAFIDTKAGVPDAIILEEDVDVSGRYIAWLQDWEGAGKVYNGPLDPGTPATADGITEGPTRNPGYFIGCTSGATTPLANSVRVESITIDNDPQHPQEQTVEGAYYRANVTLHGNTSFYMLWVPTLAPGDSVTLPIFAFCNEPASAPGDDQGNFHLRRHDNSAIPVQLVVAQVKTSANTALETTQDIVPKSFPFTFTVPAGTYTPHLLAETITSLFSVNEAGMALQKAQIRSQFMHSSDAFDVFCSANDGAYNAARHLMPSEAYFRVLPGPPHPNPEAIWVGASQIALNYSPDAQSFSFDFLHTPKQSNGKPCLSFTQYLADNAGVNLSGAPSQTWVATAHSGIAFTDLQPASLWSKTLGFNLDTLLATGHTQTAEFIGAIVDAPVPRYTLTPGKNIVTAFAGIDSGLGGTDADYYKVSVALGNDIETSLTTSIRGNSVTPAASSQGSSSHYLVEVEGVPMGEMRGAQPSVLSLAGVVGRYQTRGGFTEGSSGNGNPTLIRGAPVVVSKMRVRILMPDRTPPTDVGSRNAVYLTVSRRLRLPPPLPPVLASQPPGELPPAKKPKVAKK